MTLAKVARHARADDNDSLAFVTTRITSQVLGVSQSTLKQMRRDGLLREHKEWTRMSPGKSKSSILYNLKAVRNRLLSKNAL